MATTIEELNIILQANTAQFEAGLARAQRESAAKLTAIESRFAGFTSRLKNSASSLALGVGTSLAAAFSIDALTGYADAWTRVTRALEGSEKVFGVALKSGEDVARMAIESRSNLEELSKLYIRTAVSASKLGIDTSVAAETTVTFAKALKLGQANTAEQTAAMGQFSQALQKGKLDGDEFRTIMESAGVVQQALIEKFKVSGATLIQMAHDGKITSKDIIAALQQIKPKVDEAFGRSAATVSEAWENLKTAVTVYVGQVNQAEGGTRKLADALQAMAANVDRIAKGLEVAGITLAAILAPTVIAPLWGLVAGLAAGASAGAMLTSALVGVALAALTAFNVVRTFGAEWTVIEEKGITARALLIAFSEEVYKAVGAAIGYVSDLFAQLADAVLDLFVGFRDGAASGGKAAVEFGDVVRKVLNGLIGATTAAGYALAANFKTIFGVLPEAIIGALNSALGALEQFVRGVAALPKLLGGVSIIDEGALGIPRIPNIFAGAAADARELWKSAALAMGKDYVSAMTAAADEVKDRIIARAGDLMDAKRWRQGTTVTKDIAPPTIYPDPLDKHFTDALRKLKEHTETLLAEARAVGLGTAEKERAHAVQELLNKAKEKDIAITPQLLAQMDELARAYGNARGKLELLQAIQGKREDTEALQREVQLTGAFGEEAHRLRVEWELYAAARKAGQVVTPGSDLEAEIKRTAAANAAMQQLNDSIAAVRDTSRSALSGFINDLRAGKSGAEALAGALGKIGDKLVDMAVNGLVEAALGPLFRGAGSGGGGGGGLLSIFGFADGGVMTPAGPRALNRFAGGGISRTPAIFGETGQAEAAVPLPDGRRIPVELRLPDINAAARQASAGATASPVSVTVAPVFHVGGKVSAEDLAALETRVVRAIKPVATAAVSDAMERRPGFGRRGV